MITLKPIGYSDASSDIQLVYKRIQKGLNTQFVPLLFQIVANFPPLLFYLWERFEKNIETNTFDDSVQAITMFSQKALEQIYIPSEQISIFVKNITSIEVDQLRETAVDLSYINAKLFLLCIALRESLKGVAVGAPKLSERISEYKKKEDLDSLFDQIIESTAVRKSSEATGLTSTSNMLVPLTGSRDIVVSNYPKFFRYIQDEMDTLVKTEKYLHSRVLLEELGLSQIDRLTVPIISSYREFIELTGRTEKTKELVYLLSDIFPSKFPHLLFISSMMESVLREKS